jgi:hypothetical protein
MPPRGELQSRGRWWFGAVALVVAGLLLWAWWPFRRTAFETFWEPALRSGRPVIICLANPVVYHLSDGFNQEYARRKNFDLLAGQSITDVKPEALRPGDLVVSADQYVGSGDAYAVGSLTAMLARFERAAQIRIGNDLSFTDLRSSPAILIGAYSNRWTMKANAEYRFAFDHFSVVDRKERSQQWRLGQVSPDFKAQEDYAIVSRVMKSYSGEPVVMAAGITNMGTQAAAEFVSRPEYLNEALKSAPPEWREKNLQMVLHCRVIGSTPGPPQVVALHVW